MKNATLREIADHAGVHLSTASHVLNGGRGSTRVSAGTRERVLESARLLGYQADRAAQRLRTRRSRVVGLLVGALENPFFAHLVSRCSAALEREGYEVVLAERRRDEPADSHLLDTLLARGLDGLLAWSETATEARQRLRQPDLRGGCVVIGYPVPGRDSVVALLHQGVAAALDHLREGGRERIGFLAPDFAVSRFGDPRHAVYCEKMNAWRLRERVYTFGGPGFDIGAARARTERLWTELPRRERPDALLCFNDMVAVGALMGLRRAGVRVPDDVALVGCDDLPIAAEMDVPLSSIAYPMEEVCAAAVGLLLDRLRPEPAAGEEPGSARHIEIPTTFHARASSRPAAAAARPRWSADDRDEQKGLN